MVSLPPGENCIRMVRIAVALVMELLRKAVDITVGFGNDTFDILIFSLAQQNVAIRTISKNFSSLLARVASVLFSARSFRQIRLMEGKGTLFYAILFYTFLFYSLVVNVVVNVAVNVAVSVAVNVAVNMAVNVAVSMATNVAVSICFIGLELLKPYIHALFAACG